jgi:hypothetical protein
MWWMAAVALAGNHYTTTMPISRPRPGAWTVCLGLGGDYEGASSESVDDVSRITCSVEAEGLRVCLTLSPDAPWPTRPTELTCPLDRGKVTMKLIPAYDPHDDPVDGVTLYGRGLDHPSAAYPVPWPDQDGTMKSGACVVREGHLYLWLQRPRKDAVCTLPLSGEVPVFVDKVPKVE